MDSSDESFVWTKASSGSDDSEEMHLTITGAKSDDENEVEMEIYNKKDMPHSSEDTKTKKKKHKKEKLHFEEYDSPKKRKIKTEPQSDSEPASKKKKKQHKNVINGSLDGTFIKENDDYLDMKVKQEKEFHELSTHEKSKTNQKQNDNLDESQNGYEISLEVNENHQNDKKSKKKKKYSKDISVCEESSFVNGHTTYSEEEAKDIHRKGAKKKKHKEIRFSEQDEFNNFAEEEQSKEVEGLVQKNTKLNNVDRMDCKNGKEDNHNIYNSRENIEKTYKEKNTSVDNNIEDDYNQNDDIYNHHDNETRPKQISQKKPRLSDRIKFEDEPETDNSDSHIIPQSNTENVPSHLKRILRENHNLLPISTTSKKDLEITDNDEIWILKCPHDVDVDQFKHSDFNVDSKSKIKINGETYYGNLDDSTKINIITSSKHEFTIKNLVPNGVIYLRKRLPRPHYHEENVTVNSQTDFIPLPETKCRHPLFGPNYKDIINVHIERLNPKCNDRLVSSMNKKKSKKYKRAHDTATEIRPKTEYESEVEEKGAEVDLDSSIPLKKTKKRKHIDNNDHNGIKAKRIKLEPDSAEVWESEKAIEENLFNY